jgi:hypothetical protein
MKIFKYALLAIPFLYFSCNDDDDTPDPVNEEEVITTMIVTLVNHQNGSDVITMQSQDLDGDGPNEPVITVSGPLTAGTSYSGEVQFLNETEDPAENITEEVQEEDDEHQVFFSAAGVGMEFVYMDFDGDGNPLGTQFVLAPLGAGSGSVTITLVHEPAKPNDGLATAGGETDIEVTFDVTVE